MCPQVSLDIINRLYKFSLLLNHSVAKRAEGWTGLMHAWCYYSLRMTVP